MRFRDVQILVEKTIKAKLPILLTGAPGIGKTAIIKGAAKKAGANIIMMHPVVSDPTDFKGLPFRKSENEAGFLPYKQLKDITDAKELTVVFIDDIGQSAVSVQAALMQLLLERKINDIKVSDNVVFIAATNRRSDKAGVSGILEPVKSRFASIIDLDVNIDDWCEWAVSENLPIELISFIRFRPQMLNNFEATKEIKNSPNPRTIENVGKLFSLGLPDALKFEAFKGAVGEGFAAEFIAFLDIYKLLPSIDRIILDPDKVEIPKEPSQLFAISTALATRVKDINATNIFAYLNRMPVEFQVISVKDMLNRNSEVSSFDAFVQWAIKNGNEIL